jgi:DNA polymerase-4
MGIMSEYTPLIEPISIDEAFLDVSGCRRLFGSAEKVARTIKDRIWEEQGLHISMGVSINKFLAKFATELGKPNGLKVIREIDIPDLLTPLPVECLWGVGQKTLALLNQRGIRTIGDLRQTSAKSLEKMLGSGAHRLLQLADGIDERKVEALTEQGSIGKEITFAEDIGDYSYLLNQLLEFTDQLARRLRQRNLVGRTIVLKIRYSDFKTITRSRTITEPTDSEQVIYGVVKGLMNKIDSNGKKVRLIGISLHNLTRTEFTQEALFDDKYREERLLDQALDTLKARFGEGVIVRASSMCRHNSEPD